MMKLMKKLLNFSFVKKLKLSTIRKSKKSLRGENFEFAVNPPEFE